MRMKREAISFMPLGGGQCVGASCYYLQLGKNKILLDCGQGWYNGLHYSPNFYSLLRILAVQSLNEISQVFISHAHLDHLGALLSFFEENQRANIYMTSITKVLMDYQLRGMTNFNQLYPFIERNLLQVSYLEKILCQDYTVTFLPAGHIPGAMMTLFHFGRTNILYTGDYSLHKTSLTDGCGWTAEPVDIMILCGLHARHPSLAHKNSRLNELVLELRQAFARGKSVYYKASQLSKGVEFLKLINDVFPDKNVYIDRKIMAIIEQFERIGIPIIRANNHVWNGDDSPENNSIIISHRRWCYYTSNAVYIDKDFSLHDDFQETVEFVKRINPRVCVVVHSPPFRDEIKYGNLEQNLLFDPNCRTQVIFAENDEYYDLTL